MFTGVINFFSFKIDEWIPDDLISIILCLISLSEYGTIRTGAVLATFDADINSGNLRLRATPTSADSTVFKLSKTTVKV